MAETPPESAGFWPGIPASKPIQVAAGLIFFRGRLLIAQRRPGEHLGGLWEFPGGKVELGESFQDCLRRELAEELGVEAQPLDLLQTIVHSYPEKTVELQFYRCRLVRGEARPLGCHALAWVTAQELSRYEFPAADAALIQLLQERGELWSC
jgi:mutator protein MutT